MADVNSIKQAFTLGSGISDSDMTTLGMITLLGLLFVIVLSVILKRLVMFKKDQDAFEVLKVTLSVFLTVVVVLVISKFVIV